MSRLPVGRLFLGLLLAAVATLPAQAQIVTPAKQAILMDYNTGEVLFCKACDERTAPSSMSKLMTVELVFQRLKDGRLKLTDKLHVSKKAWQQGLHDNESKMFVAVNSNVPVDDLLKGIIVQSGGDACVVVAEAIAGTEAAFAKLENARAKQLGLTNSHFTNASGLPDPDHYMSVHDIAKLSAHLIRAYPQYYHYFSIPEFTWSNIRQVNRNHLLFMNIGADGLKTGHTEAGGYGIVGSAVRNGRRLIVVLNGLDSEAARNNEGARLLNIGFREFRSYALFAANQQVGEAKVWGGAQNTVPVEVTEPVRATMSPDAREHMKVTLSYRGPIKAPIAKGQKLGMVTVSAPGKPERSFPVVAAQAVPTAGLFGNIWIGLQALIAKTSKSGT